MSCGVVNRKKRQRCKSDSRATIIGWDTDPHYKRLWRKGMRTTLDLLQGWLDLGAMNNLQSIFLPHDPLAQKRMLAGYTSWSV
jgi:hypothetical protein